MNSEFGIKILIFGQLTDIIESGELIVEGIKNTNNLNKHLSERYPELLLSKYSMAVNKIIIQENTLLNDGDVVALLPPFSGG